MRILPWALMVSGATRQMPFCPFMARGARARMDLARQGDRPGGSADRTQAEPARRALGAGRAADPLAEWPVAGAGAVERRAVRAAGAADPVAGRLAIAAGGGAPPVDPT